MSNSEGIGTLRLACPQGHPVGRIVKDMPHQMVQFDPGASGARRFWPEEEDQPQFRIGCAQCDRQVGESTVALQAMFNELVYDATQSRSATTLAYV